MRENRWIEYNPNPNGENVGDCTIRAISVATGDDWDTVYAKLSLHGFMLKDMPSANHVWGSYLREKGFKRRIIDDGGKTFYTVRDFCEEHASGVYILAIQGHVVGVRDGFYYDTWDSGNEIPLYYWEE